MTPANIWSAEKHVLRARDESSPAQGGRQNKAA
jgi:hypothetical protein